MWIMQFFGAHRRVGTGGQRRPARRFWRNSDGSLAIEFALLAGPFAVLLFAIIESCVSFAGQQLLSNAAEDVARQFRTGKIKAADVEDAEELHGMICERIKILVAEGCTGLEVDLRAYDTFAQAAAVRIIYTGSGGTRDLAGSNFGFSPGRSQTKNMLRVFYKWPVMTDLMRLAMSNLEGSKTLLFATVTWQNEPFDD